MNKFEKAQHLLQDINGDGWLIICENESDIHSQYLLGVESHALHAIFIAADGKHKVLPVVMEVNMIKNSLNEKGIDADIIPHISSNDLRDKLKPIINKPKVALNFGENVFDSEGTQYADYLPFGA
ncbi:MAG: hypothetical protein ACFFDH_20545, partial [Promethearchaeota archaeon]